MLHDDELDQLHVEITATSLLDQKNTRIKIKS